MAYLVVNNVVLLGAAETGFSYDDTIVLQGATEIGFDVSLHGPIVHDMPVRNARFGQLYPPRSSK